MLNCPSTKSAAGTTQENISGNTPCVALEESGDTVEATPSFWNMAARLRRRTDQFLVELRGYVEESGTLDGVNTDVVTEIKAALNDPQALLFIKIWVEQNLIFNIIRSDATIALGYTLSGGISGPIIGEGTRWILKNLYVQLRTKGVLPKKQRHTLAAVSMIPCVGGHAPLIVIHEKYPHLFGFLIRYTKNRVLQSRKKGNRLEENQVTTERERVRLLFSGEPTPPGKWLKWIAGRSEAIRPTGSDSDTPLS